MRLLTLACLCGAQLSYGLSTEYSKQPQASNQEKVDADRDKYAKFYVHQILSMGEEGIRDAYRRVSGALWDGHLVLIELQTQLGSSPRSTRTTATTDGPQ